TLLGITVAVAALVATMVYGSGLHQFTSTPARYGWPWNYQVVVDGAEPAAVAKALAAMPAVGTYAPGVFSQFDIKGRSVAGLGIGAATTAHAIQTLGAPLGQPFFVVMTRPGKHLEAATIDRTLRDATRGDFGVVLGAQRPNDVLSYDHLSRTPLVLAGVLVL